MNSAGYKVTYSQCDKKFRNLKATYRSVCDNNKKTGRGRKKWQYFSIFNDMFSDSAATSPVGAEIGAAPQECLEGTAGNENLEYNENANSITPTGIRSARKRSHAQPPPWFDKFMKQSEQAEESRLKLLQEMHDESKRQAAERVEILRDLNSNIRFLIDKL